MNNVKGLLRCGIQYPNVSVCTCMCIANKISNFTPILALVTNRDCDSHVGALRHSMSTITVFNKWSTNF